MGRNFVEYTNKYIGGDVSKVILERNSHVFSHLQIVEFKHFSLSYDNLPRGDVCFVRQVLQLLSSAAIKTFVIDINKHRAFEKLIITEHLPLQQDFKEIQDKPTGAQLRLIFGNSSALDKPPFNLLYSSKYDLVKVKPAGEIIKTTVYCYLVFSRIKYYSVFVKRWFDYIFGRSSIYILKVVSFF